MKIDENFLSKQDYFKAVKGDIRFVNLTDRLQYLVEALNCKPIDDHRWRPKKIIDRLNYGEYVALMNFHKRIHTLAFPEVGIEDWRPYDIEVKVTLRDKKRRVKRPEK